MRASRAVSREAGDDDGTLCHVFSGQDGTTARVAHGANETPHRFAGGADALRATLRRGGTRVRQSLLQQRAGSLHAARPGEGQWTVDGSTAWSTISRSSRTTATRSSGVAPRSTAIATHRALRGGFHKRSIPLLAAAIARNCRASTATPHLTRDCRDMGFSYILVKPAGRERGRASHRTATVVRHVVDACLHVRVALRQNQAMRWPDVFAPGARSALPVHEAAPNHRADRS